MKTKKSRRHTGQIGHCVDTRTVEENDIWLNMIHLRTCLTATRFTFRPRGGPYSSW